MDEITRAEVRPMNRRDRDLRDRYLWLRRRHPQKPRLLRWIVSPRHDRQRPTNPTANRRTTP
jgi:hypothetical protein